ncbi:MAG: hypothetical protein V4608_05880 [Bacteroidota bacterium]
MRIAKLLFFVFLFSCYFDAASQQVSNSAIVEQTTAELFVSKNWQKLIKYGEQAIKDGYNYYYLQLRVGIACYEQKKFMRAIGHFEKALQFNSSDPLALEYLYYSYLFSGRSTQARALAATFPYSLKEKIKYPKNKFIKGIYTEGGIASSNLDETYRAIDIDGPFNKYGETTITKNMRYFHIGVNHELSSIMSVYHGYNNINIDQLRKIRINNKDTFDSFKLTQHDYYINTVLQFKHFAFSPALHLINVSFAKLNSQYNENTYKYFFSKKDTSFINYAASFSLSKNCGIYTYTLTPGYSQLNGLTQIQTGLSIAYFPLGVPDYYGTSSLIYLNENNTNRLILSQKIGLKLIPKLWMEAGITYGNLQNYSENNAFVVFNTGDKIKYKYGVSLTSPLSKHLELSIRYDCFNRINTYYLINNVQTLESRYVSYKTQAIIGGIKWNL